MKIKRLVIENFKSIERIELVEPNPFTVFVGPNGSGKSNIFEGLEFVNISRAIPEQVNNLFGGHKALFNRVTKKLSFHFGIDFVDFQDEMDGYFSDERKRKTDQITFNFNDIHLIDPEHSSYEQFYHGFTRLFVGNQKLVKFPYNGDQRLSLSASNLEKVLKRVLSENILKNEVFEWLELFIPGFKAVEVDERDELHWFEQPSVDYFTKELISDGTYNILALLTAVYQSEEPQFLCVEEPENGLHPDVIKEFVNLCRYACEQFGHFIWLNTHSQTLAAQLTADEIIVVDKVNGVTQTKQFRGRDFHGLRMDEAWLMNALGGGLPW